MNRSSIIIFNYSSRQADSFLASSMLHYILTFLLACCWAAVINSFFHRNQISRTSSQQLSKSKSKSKCLSSTELGLIEDAAIAATNAFVGGTVGVMSVMFMLEMKEIQDKTLEGCPYCMGNGEILCALCFGKGMISENMCSCCSGRGLVTCINCKGDGRETPIILQSKAVRDPEYATDSIGIDSP